MIKGKCVGNHPMPELGLGRTAGGKLSQKEAPGTGGNKDNKQKGKSMDLARLIGPVLCLPTSASCSLPPAHA